MLASFSSEAFQRPKARDLRGGFFYFLLLFFFVTPPSVKYIFPQIVSSFITVAKAMSVCIIFVLYLSHMVKKGSRVDVWIVAVLIYEVLFIASTAINGTDLVEALKRALPEVCVCLLIASAAKGRRIYPFLWIARIYFAVVSIINLITIIAFPEGMYYTKQPLNWFLGFDNVFIFSFLTGIVISCVLDYFDNGLNRLSASTILLLVLALIESIIRHTATSLIMLVVLTVLLLLRRGFIRNENYPDMGMASIGMVIIAILAVLALNFDYRVVLDAFSSISSKAVAIEDRIKIWNAAIRLIGESPIIGYGCMPYDQIVGQINFSHPHNEILETLISGGVVRLVALASLVFLVSKRLHELKRNALGYVVGCIVAMYFLRWSVESMNLYWQLITFSIAFYIPEIIEESVDRARDVTNRIQGVGVMMGIQDGNTDNPIHSSSR